MKKRNCRFEVRFTKDELSDLTRKARKARLTNAAFIRRAVCGAEVKEAPPADVPQLIGETISVQIVHMTFHAVALFSIRKKIQANVTKIKTNT